MMTGLFPWQRRPWSKFGMGMVDGLFAYFMKWQRWKWKHKTVSLCVFPYPVHYLAMLTFKM